MVSQSFKVLQKQIYVRDWGSHPSARTLQTSDEEIGEMMRMVIAHEVGHALGFPHNRQVALHTQLIHIEMGSLRKNLVLQQV